MEKYKHFLEEFDKKISLYQQKYSSYIYCKIGCADCCKKGDYPISQLELEYIMQGYISLDAEQKLTVQNNIKNIKKGGQCPFLIDNKCSIYQYRPIICRVHGLAYFCNNQIVKVPYCVNTGKNYNKVYADGKIEIEPIAENLDTPTVLEDFNYGEIRALFDWIKPAN